MMNSLPIKKLFIDSMRENYSRKQAHAIADEYALWGKDWEFELSAINGATAKVWHGEKDLGTTIQMGRYIAKEINCELVSVPDKGHMLFFDVLNQVLDWVSSSGRQSRSHSTGRQGSKEKNLHRYSDRNDPRDWLFL
jgi:pimeloyl-ACP methyl ester carboxylesterase